MPRKEQFAFGAALVASALAVILSKSLAWFILVIGLGLVFDFYLRDLIWGPDRLTREEIEKMPAEEYKARVLGNSKTENWVNWLTSGRDAFKTHMRKLAREAVIFMLVTPVLVFIGSFGYLYHDAHKQTTSSAAGNPYGLETIPGWESIPCKDGESYTERGRVIWTCQNGKRTAPKINDIPGFTPDTSNIPVPLPGYVPVPPDASFIPIQPSPAESTSDMLVSALWFGLYGIPSGFGLWVFYRAVYFAVKG